MGILKVNLYPKTVINIPPIITKANDGSQFLEMSKNECTLYGLSIPESVKPNPKIRPDKHVKRYLIVINYPRKYTVNMPEPTNVIVAINDLNENLERPQIPWPEVQPLPIDVPIPTNNPATTSIDGFETLTELKSPKK